MLLIECVRNGHVGHVGVEKQLKKIYLHENEIYFPKERRFIVTPLTWPP